MADEQHEPPRTHHNCGCRDCSPIPAMLERMDAWKAAAAMLRDGIVWDEETKGPSPMEVGSLAAWLYEGSDDNG